MVAVRCVKQHKLFHQVCVKDFLVEGGKTCVPSAKPKFISLVHLNEFLGIADLLSEKHKCGQLAHHVCANGDHVQLGLGVEPRVVHGEVYHLLIVDDSGQMGSSKGRFVVRQAQEEPFPRREFTNLNAIGLHS